MQSLRLAVRRSGAPSGLLATVAAVALVLTALVVGITGYLDFSATVNTRTFVAAVAPTASSIRVETKLADDPASQADAAKVVLDHELSGLPVAVTRTLTDFPLPATLDDSQLTLPDSGEAHITVSSDVALDSNATLVAGQWPSASTRDGTVGSPIPGALQSDAAKQLDLAVGDVLAVGIGSDTKSIAIVGTWLPKDANDSRWFGDSGVATGNAIPAGDGTRSFGPLMVDESVPATIGPIRSVHWTIALDAARVTPPQFKQFSTVATNLRQHLIENGAVRKGDILVH